MLHPLYKNWLDALRKEVTREQENVLAHYKHRRKKIKEISWKERKDNEMSKREKAILFLAMPVVLIKWKLIFKRTGFLGRRWHDLVDSLATLTVAHWEWDCRGRRQDGGTSKEAVAGSRLVVRWLEDSSRGGKKIDMDFLKGQSQNRMV